MEHSHRGPMTGKTVVVTGGTAGIGRATALGLARLGAHLAITGRDRARAEDAAREIHGAADGQVDGCASEWPRRCGLKASPSLWWRMTTR